MANSANTLTSQMISFNYDFDGNQPKSLIYQGDAHFPLDIPFLRLTKTDDSGKPLPSSAGRVVHSTPILFSEDGRQMYLETIIKFKIKTVDNNPGDGLVFFIAPVGTTIPSGSSGETFGVFKSATGKTPSVFAVEFDTYVNPDVDPNYRHIGIDIECPISSNTTKVDDAILGQEVTARINYVATTKMISVVVTTHDSKIYDVKHECDLSTVLEQQVQVGLAASTGANVAIHDVVSWYFKANLVRETAN